jgi:hypothetical protein
MYPGKKVVSEMAAIKPIQLITEMSSQFKKRLLLVGASTNTIMKKA